METKKKPGFSWDVISFSSVWVAGAASVGDRGDPGHPHWLVWVTGVASHPTGGPSTMVLQRFSMDFIHFSIKLPLLKG